MAQACRFNTGRVFPQKNLRTHMIDNTAHKGGSLCHPVFDAERFVRLLATDKHRATALISILANVISNGQTPISEARSAFARRQPAQAAHVIHNLKGCIANLGGMRVYEVACELEPKLEAGVDIEDAEYLLNQLEDELKVYLETAQKWIADISFKNRQTSVMQEEQLQLLKTYLLDSNILACELFESLRPNLRAQLNTRDYDGLLKAMDNMNFAQAMVHLACAK